jgi:hypothetical protein
LADLATANFGEFIFHAIGKRLKVAAGLTEAETLRRELLNFRVKINPQTAHEGPPRPGGDAAPRVSTLRKLAKGLDVDPRELLED